MELLPHGRPLQEGDGLEHDRVCVMFWALLQTVGVHIDHVDHVPQPPFTAG